MTLTFFNPANESNERLPLASDYYATYGASDEAYEVLSLKLTRKKNAYYCITAKFAFLLWLEQALTKQVIEALDVYCKQMHGYKLYAVICDEHPNFKLAVDFDRATNWFHSLGKYSQQAIITSTSEPVATNPFLPTPTPTRHKSKSQPTSHPPTENTKSGV